MQFIRLRFSTCHIFITQGPPATVRTVAEMTDASKYNKQYGNYALLLNPELQPLL